MGYLPATDHERSEMLRTIGADSIDDLFSSIPAPLRAPALDLPEPLGEQQLTDLLSDLAAENRPLSAYASFLGAGVYHRYIPALVRATIARPEFYSAYTPYQAEASQGTLQTIFEFQTMICALTGLDVANASLYDGATAAAEAAILACFHTGRPRIAASAALHPEVLAVLRTFVEARGGGVDLIATTGGITAAATVAAIVDARHAAVMVAQPGYLGTLETELSAIATAAHAAGALAIAVVDPLACTVLTPPGEQGYDVGVGDGQQLGIPESFGGPHVGFMAVRQSLLRRLPGRLVGLTKDHAGRRAYCLTLQTREQHIRRERATSNICTNHALMALAATVYMAQLGSGGMRAIVTVSSQRAHHLASLLTAMPGFSLRFPEQSFLWEFALRVPGNASDVAERLRAQGVLGGLPLQGEMADTLLVACTEMTTAADIERYATAATSLAAVGAHA